MEEGEVEEDIAYEEEEEEEDAVSGSWNILHSNVLNENEAVMDISLEDLDTGVIVSEEETNVRSSDDEKLDEYREALSSCGFLDLKEVDLDGLTRLFDIVVELEDKSNAIRNIRRSIERTLEELRVCIMSSKSTESNRDETLDSSLLKANVASGFDDAIHNSIYKYIEDMVAKGHTNLDARYVVERCQRIVESSGVTVSLKLEDLYLYAKQVIHQVVKYYTDAKYDDSRIIDMRRRTADLILRKEELSFYDFFHADEDDIYFIRNIFQDKERFFLVCDSCGEKIPLENALIDLYRIPLNRDSGDSKEEGSYSLPKPVRCSCGAFHVVIAKDYQMMGSGLYKFYKSEKKKSRSNQLYDVISNVTSLCNGASFIKVSSPFRGVQNSLLHLIRENYETSSSGGEEKNVSEAATFETGIVFNDLEFREAVNNFYEKLKCFKPSVVPKPRMVAATIGEEEGELEEEAYPLAGKSMYGEEDDTLDFGYKQMAAVMIDILGLDYATVKTQAIFSLCYYLSEHPYFASNFDILKKCELDRAVSLLRVLTANKFEKLNTMQISYLKELYYTYYEVKEGMSAEEILQELVENSDVVEEQLRLQNNNWEEALSFLKKYSYVFKYCKLVNIASYQREDLDRFLGNLVSFPVIDEITDEMIVTNLAGDYYEQWFLFNIIKKKDLRDTLVVKATARTSLSSLMGGICKHALKSGIKLDMEKLENSFRAVVASSIEEHRWLRDAYNYLKVCDYYRFYNSILKCPADFDSYLSDEFTREVIDAVKFVEKTLAIEPGVSIGTYYLSQDFSQEELTSFKDNLELLPFGKFILKRDKEETLEEYAERFKRLFNEGNLTQENSYDFYTRTFEKIRKSSVIISLAAMFSSIEYNSYMTSVFMEQCIQQFFKIGLKKAFFSFFNLSDDYLNAVNNNTKFFDSNDFEASLNEPFYKMKYEFYFTDVNDIVAKMCSKYDSQVVRSSEGLAEANKNSGKMRLIEKIMEEVHQYNPILAESADTSEDLMKELEFVLGTDIVSKFAGI